MQFYLCIIQFSGVIGHCDHHIDLVYRTRIVFCLNFSVRQSDAEGTRWKKFFFRGIISFYIQVQIEKPSKVEAVDRDELPDLRKVQTGSEVPFNRQVLKPVHAEISFNFIFQKSRLQFIHTELNRFIVMVFTGG